MWTSRIAAARLRPNTRHRAHAAGPADRPRSYERHDPIEDE